ncbi:hypothetical protein F5148DRAFT_1214753 [Russula earlei]|uniref:Uncharacterized protein n=1 Tax=Russula earlei TaxID=71964 RepID=A0ACC0U473_9AGAM|nr:hypothetical protein F5148DRAFT_1214753 [Russula earlei]
MLIPLVFTIFGFVVAIAPSIALPSSNLPGAPSTFNDLRKKHNGKEYRRAVSRYKDARRQWDRVKQQFELPNQELNEGARVASNLAKDPATGKDAGKAEKNLKTAEKEG